MSDASKPTPGQEIRALRVAQGMSQEDVAKALDISLKTVGRIEREGRGHHLRRIRTFLERLAADPPGITAVRSIRTFIEQQSVPGGRPLSLAFHELAALLDRLPVE